MALVLVSLIDDQIPRGAFVSRTSLHERRREIARRIAHELGEHQSESDQVPLSPPISWSRVQMTGIS